MKLIYSIIKLVFAIGIFIIADTLLSFPLAWMLDWFLKLSVFWSIVVAFMFSGILWLFIVVTIWMISFVKKIGSLEKATSFLICLYLIVSSILAIRNFYNFFDFSITKEALAGIWIIIFFAIKAIYGSIFAFMPKEETSNIFKTNS